MIDYDEKTCDGCGHYAYVEINGEYYSLCLCDHDERGDDTAAHLTDMGGDCDCWVPEPPYRQHRPYMFLPKDANGEAVRLGDKVQGIYAEGEVYAIGIGGAYVTTDGGDMYERYRDLQHVGR